jgi:serine phosphatase RsbU (regulator of sigma subunit)
MKTEHVFLTMKKNNKMDFMTGIGKFTPKTEENKQEFLKILDDPLQWDQGCLVPLSVGELPLGLLFVDELSQEARDTEILELFTSQAAYAFENLKIQADREEQKVREQELKIGKNIQESLLPKAIPQSKDIELYGLMNSAKEIGGDYYDFLNRETPDHKVTDDIYVSIGDVAGKGVPAGLIMSEVRSFIRALIPFYDSPKKILEFVARLLEKDLWGTGKFMSLLLMLWDSRAKKFRFTSAGHEHVIHYIAKQGKCSFFKAGGMVLGLKHELVIQQMEENELILEPNDVMVLFTDGATEAMNEAGEMLSLENIVSLTEQYAHLPVDQIVNNVLQKIYDFIGEYEQFDDITMVAVKRKSG